MACRGCKKRSKEFRKALKAKRREEMRAKIENKMVDKDTIHWMNVYPHGVPDGFKCQTCEKVISIPEDAKIKPIVEEE